MTFKRLLFNFVIFRVWSLGPAGSVVIVCFPSGHRCVKYCNQIMYLLLRYLCSLSMQRHRPIQRILCVCGVGMVDDVIKVASIAVNVSWRTDSFSSTQYLAEILNGHFLMIATYHWGKRALFATLEVMDLFFVCRKREQGAISGMRCILAGWVFLFPSPVSRTSDCPCHYCKKVRSLRTAVVRKYEYSVWIWGSLYSFVASYVDHTS